MAGLLASIAPIADFFSRIFGQGFGVTDPCKEKSSIVRLISDRSIFRGSSLVLWRRKLKQEEAGAGL